tara:strand:- start:407 stop:559 length:153 start_codon:yes stop_codon:yes gene_type:complete
MLKLGMYRGSAMNVRKPMETAKVTTTVITSSCESLAHSGTASGHGNGVSS